MKQIISLLLFLITFSIKLIGQDAVLTLNAAWNEPIINKKLEIRFDSIAQRMEFCMYNPCVLYIKTNARTSSHDELQLRLFMNSKNTQELISIIKNDVVKMIGKNKRKHIVACSSTGAPILVNLSLNSEGYVYRASVKLELCALHFLHKKQIRKILKHVLLKNIFDNYPSYEIPFNTTLRIPIHKQLLLVH